MINYSFFGSAVLVGIIFEIDRFFVVSEFCFESVIENSIDVVFDRDFIFDMLFLFVMI